MSCTKASPLKKDFRHRKADEEIRREFLEVKSVYEERLHPFVYIDESGFRKDISRPYGYALRGQKCAGVSGWSKAQTNVIGALCGTVPFAFTAFDCSIDSDVFHTWATEILLPELPACSVIVMDNTPPSTSGRTRWMRYRLRDIWCCGFRPIARI